MICVYDLIGGLINLVLYIGECVIEVIFKGVLILIYFGFIYCLDICFGMMVVVNCVYDFLLDGVVLLQMLLIIVDFECDMLEVMVVYVEMQVFLDNFVGLIGSKEDIEVVVEVFIVQYEWIEMLDSLVEYIMDYIFLFYFMDENWQLKMFFVEVDVSLVYVVECLVQYIGQVVLLNFCFLM